MGGWPVLRGKKGQPRPFPAPHCDSLPPPSTAIPCQLLSNGFEEAREKGLTPFMLLPGKPPQALRTDVPLQEAGIKAGDTKVGAV